MIAGFEELRLADKLMADLAKVSLQINEIILW